MEQNEVVTSSKKTIKILFVIAVLLFGITGGLAYANYSEYDFNLGNKTFPENLSLTLGEYGIHKAIYDKEKGLWTIGLWEITIIKPGSRNITELQKKGGVIVFEMPWNGEIYSSTGEFYINGKLWTHGNPVTNSEGKSLIKKGQEVEIRYEKDNSSAGFQIWFE